MDAGIRVVHVSTSGHRDGDKSGVEIRWRGEACAGQLSGRCCQSGLSVAAADESGHRAVRSCVDSTEASASFCTQDIEAEEDNQSSTVAAADAELRGELMVDSRLRASCKLAGIVCASGRLGGELREDARQDTARLEDLARGLELTFAQCLLARQFADSNLGSQHNLDRR